MVPNDKHYLREVTYGEITEKVNKIRIMNSDKEKGLHKQRYDNWHLRGVLELND